MRGGREGGGGGWGGRMGGVGSEVDEQILITGDDRAGIGFHGFGEVPGQHIVLIELHRRAVKAGLEVAHRGVRWKSRRQRSGRICLVYLLLQTEMPWCGVVSDVDEP